MATRSSISCMCLGSRGGTATSFCSSTLFAKDCFLSLTSMGCWTRTDSSTSFLSSAGVSGVIPAIASCISDSAASATGTSSCKSCFISPNDAEALSIIRINSSRNRADSAFSVNSFKIISPFLTRTNIRVSSWQLSALPPFPIVRLILDSRFERNTFMAVAFRCSPARTAIARSFIVAPFLNNKVYRGGMGKTAKNRTVKSCCAVYQLLAQPAGRVHAS